MFPEFAVVLLQIGGTGGPCPQIPHNEPWLLLGAIALCVISGFLLHQGVAFQRWVTGGEEGAPDPKAGVELAWVSSVAMAGVWVLYWFLSLPGFEREGQYLLFRVLTRSKDLAPAPLLASMVPGALAVFKFLLAGSMMQAAHRERSPLIRSPLAAITGAVFAILQIAASIVTLIMFFRR
ncbi:MAG: hypothetical protein M3R52_00960 [Acidobacteriota bacterium]|nr:hypothetical protein [Acidobacteriota bacterium]